VVRVIAAGRKALQKIIQNQYLIYNPQRGILSGGMRAAGGNPDKSTPAEIRRAARPPADFGCSRAGISTS
jgi:hypothetical protein